MEKKNILITLLIVLSLPFANALYEDLYLPSTYSFDGTYNKISISEYFTQCYQATWNNVTGDIRVKIDVQLDNPKMPYVTDCLQGATSVMFLDRSIFWLPIGESSIMGDNGLVPYTYYSNRDTPISEIDNTKQWKRVFNDASGSDLGFREDKLTIKPAALNGINVHLYQDLTTTSIISASEAYFYEALFSNSGLNNIVGVSGYMSPDGLTKVTTDAVIADGVGHNYKFLDINTVSFLNQYKAANYTNINFLPAGNRDNCIGYCINTEQLDLDIERYQRGFFTFNKYLDYYYYPFYVKNSVITITGYDSNLTNRNAIYTKTLTVASTSNVIKIPMNNNGMIDTLSTRIKGSSGISYRIHDPLNLGSEIIYDDKVTTVPPNVKHVKVNIRTYIFKNYLYRHKTPVDIPPNHFLLRTTEDCEANEYFAYLVRNNTAFSIFCPTNDISIGEFQTLQADYTTEINLLTNSDNQTQTPVSDYPTVQNESNLIIDPIGNSTTDGMENINNTGTNQTIGVDWNNAGEGGESSGGLENQLIYNLGLSNIEKKASFFIALQEIQIVIFEIFLVIFTIIGFVLLIIMFFVLPSAAYSKMIKEFKTLVRK